MGIFRNIIEYSTKFICWANKNRRIELPVGVIKVNIGCGLAVTKGWINVDGSLNAFIATLPSAIHRIAYRITGANRYYSIEEYCSLLGNNAFTHHDLSYGIPFADESVDFLYSSHFMEHLHKNEALNLLRESYRVLKKNGVVRVCVPDLAYAVSLYGVGNTERMLDSYFFVEDKASNFARHKYMYDYNLMKAMLEKVGFVGVVKCAYRDGVTPDIELLDNRPDETLFVEARR